MSFGSKRPCLPRLSGTSHYSGRALFPVYMRKPKQARETNCYKGSFTKPVQNSILQQNDAYDNLAFFASRMASVNTDLRSNERNQIEADLDQYYRCLSHKIEVDNQAKPSAIRITITASATLTNPSPSTSPQRICSGVNSIRPRA